jgi:hypothetical protein
VGGWVGGCVRACVRAWAVGRVDRSVGESMGTRVCDSYVITQLT